MKIKVKNILLIIPFMDILANEVAILRPLRLGFLLILLLHLGVNYGFQKKNTTLKLILIFSLYLIVLSLTNSSSFLTSIDSTVKSSLSLLYYYLGACLIHTNYTISDYNKQLKTSALLIFAVIVMANLFNIGDINYHSSSNFYFGNTGVNIVKSLAIFLAGFPLLFNFQKKKISIAYFLFAIGIVIIILSTKRSALLVVALSFFFFIKDNVFKNKNYKILVLLGILTVGSAYLLRDTLQANFEARQKELTFDADKDYDREWRYVESLIAIDRYKNSNLTHKLIGNETFNEVSAYQQRYMFHNDFATLLSSTGLIGLFLYMAIVFSMFLRYLKYRKVSEPEQYAIVNQLFVLLLILVFLAIAGNLKFLGGSLAIIMYFFGATEVLIKKSINGQ